MKMIRFNADFFGTDGSGNSRKLFEAGKDYPPDNEEAKRGIARGIAEEVDVDEPEVPAADPAASAADSKPAEGDAAAADSKTAKAKK